MNEGIEVFAKADIPDRLHYRADPKILDVLALSRGVQLIVGDLDQPDVFVPEPNDSPAPGLHGFDDLSPDPGGYEEGAFSDMRAIFYAMGPAFKKKRVHQWIKLVDEFQAIVFCSSLDIDITGSLPDPRQGDGRGRLGEAAQRELGEGGGDVLGGDGRVEVLPDPGRSVWSDLVHTQIINKSCSNRRQCP